jgi:hypothetical protein
MQNLGGHSFCWSQPMLCFAPLMGCMLFRTKIFCSNRKACHQVNACFWKAFCTDAELLRRRLAEEIALGIGDA